MNLSQGDLQRLCLTAGVSAEQMKALEARPQDLQCFLSAALYYFQSGDLWGAAMRMLDCLMAGTSLQVDWMGCLTVFVTDMMDGVHPVMALFGLLACFLGISPPDPGELEPPNYQEVRRCG